MVSSDVRDREKKNFDLFVDNTSLVCRKSIGRSALQSMSQSILKIKK
jgi:hypothetical protein